MDEAALSGWVILVFFVAAILYSSVGHGGASAYLGILALAGYSRPDIAPVVLVLNIIVTSTGVWNYYRAGHFSVRLLLPFVVASVPAAFLGGMMTLSPRVFSAILGLALLVAGLRFVIFARPVSVRSRLHGSLIYGVGLPAGFGLGFLAGVIGIGGGIFLSPLLLMIGWADVKKTAAVSAGFIILNSLSGLMAHSIRGPLNWELMFPLAGAVLLGGVVGSWWGAHRIPPVPLQRVLGVVLLAASFKLIMGLW